MRRYRYAFKTFDKEHETVAIPDVAIGVTVDTFRDLCTVHYLVPVEDEVTADG